MSGRAEQPRWDQDRPLDSVQFRVNNVLKGVDDEQKARLIAFAMKNITVTPNPREIAAYDLQDLSEFFTSRLESNDDEERKFAALGTVFLRDKEAIPALFKALPTSGAYSTPTILEAIGELGDISVFPEFERLLDDSTIVADRRLLFENYAKIGKDKAYPRLKATLLQGDENDLTLVTIGEMMAEIQPDDAYSSIRQMLMGRTLSNDFVTKTLLGIFAKNYFDKDQSFLINFFQDPSWDLRWAVYKGFEKSTSLEVYIFLRENYEQLREADWEAKDLDSLINKIVENSREKLKSSNSPMLAKKVKGLKDSSNTGKEPALGGDRRIALRNTQQMLTRKKITSDFWEEVKEIRRESI